MQQLPILVLKGCPCVEASLHSLHVPSGFGERAGSEVIMGHIFPRVCWQLLCWWEVGVEMEGLEPEPGVSQGFSYAQWLTVSYQG